MMGILSLSACIVFCLKAIVHRAILCLLQLIFNGIYFAKFRQNRFFLYFICHIFSQNRDIIFFLLKKKNNTNRILRRYNFEALIYGYNECEIKLILDIHHLVNSLIHDYFNAIKPLDAHISLLFLFQIKIRIFEQLTLK